MRLNLYLQSVSLMVDHARAQHSPYTVQMLIQHLSQEAARLYSSSQELRFMSEGAQGLTKTTMLDNAEQFREYADHLIKEVGRLIPMHVPPTEPFPTNALPYVTPREEA